MSREINIEFGCLAEPLTKQLPPLGFSGPRSRVLQARADAITTLHIGALLTRREVHSARTRLVKAIENELRGYKVKA